MCGWGVSVSVQALHQPDPTSRPPGPHRDPPACLIGRSHRAYRLPSRAQSHYISVTWQRRVSGAHLIASPRVAAACVRAFIQSPSHRDSCAASLRPTPTLASSSFPYPHPPSLTHCRPHAFRPSLPIHQLNRHYSRLLMPADSVHLYFGTLPSSCSPAASAPRCPALLPFRPVRGTPTSPYT